jgi:predicted nucleic acid-binding protein
VRVMVDTNVILDVWLLREPYWKESATLVSWVEQGKLAGYLCPTTITTLHYLGKSALGEKQARVLLGQLLDIFNVGVLTPEIFRDALSSRITDFEDAVIEAVSLATEVDLIATRNLKDFRRSRVHAKSPAQLLQLK